MAGTPPDIQGLTHTHTHARELLCHKSDISEIMNQGREKFRNRCGGVCCRIVGRGMNDWISAAGRDKQEEVPYDIILRANNSEYVALWVKLREKSL